MEELYQDLLEGGAIPDADGGIYLGDGMCVYPDGSVG